MSILHFPKPLKPQTNRHSDCSIGGAMKKVLKKYVLTFPMLAIGIAAFGANYTYTEMHQGGSRNLSGDPKEYEITLNNIKLDAVSRVSEKKDVFLRLRFDDTTALEIGRGQKWELKQGAQILVDQKIPLESRFIQGDETKFVLEVVFEQNIWNVTKSDVTLLRCNTLAKELSAYNRSFQCFIPGEKTAVLTYRVAEKGVPPMSDSENQVAGL